MNQRKVQESSEGISVSECSECISLFKRPLESRWIFFPLTESSEFHTSSHLIEDCKFLRLGVGLLSSINSSSVYFDSTNGLKVCSLFIRLEQVLSLAVATWLHPLSKIMIFFVSSPQHAPATMNKLRRNRYIMPHFGSCKYIHFHGQKSILCI